MSTNLIPEIMSPEGMEVIEAYLQNDSDIDKAARSIGVSKFEFMEVYNRREVKKYIDDLFLQSGFRNRGRLFGVLDQIVNIKLEEMEASGVGSDQDIMDILWKIHKMKMEEMKMAIEYEKARAGNTVVNQTNIQNNIAGSGDDNYMALIQRIARGEKVN